MLDIKATKTHSHIQPGNYCTKTIFEGGRLQKISASDSNIVLRYADFLCDFFLYFQRRVPILNKNLIDMTGFCLVNVTINI